MATSCAALAVLSDAALLRTITQFQRGLPRDLLALLQALPEPHARGALPRLALELRDASLLRRLHRLHCAQHIDFQRRLLHAMAFDGVWLDALRVGDLGAVAWIEQHAATIPGLDHHAPEATLQPACASGRVDVVAWLLAKRPEWRTRFTAACVASVSSAALFAWLAREINALPCSSEVMDAAATHGRLDLVRYLHTHRSEGCTTAAMDGAATHGHLEVVRFLHTHRAEGATAQAIAGAAEHGHLEVVKFLASNGISESSILPISKAALYGHVEIVQYLHTRLPATLVGLRRRSCRPRARSAKKA